MASAAMLTAQQLAPCVSCHGEFENPAVVLEKRAAMVDAILNNRMPPGLPAYMRLTQNQKKVLLDDITNMSQVAEKARAKQRAGKKTRRNKAPKSK